MSKIKIETGLLGEHSKIMIDDVDMSAFLKGAIIKLEVGSYNAIEMNCMFPVGTELEFDGECLEDKIKICSKPCIQCNRFIHWEDEKKLNEGGK